MSLETALRHMRDSSRPMTVWADALCINQQDVEERNAQVQMMGKIYSGATRTIIFLGEETRHALAILKACRGDR